MELVQLLPKLKELLLVRSTFCGSSCIWVETPLLAEHISLYPLLFTLEHPVAFPPSLALNEVSCTVIRVWVVRFTDKENLTWMHRLLHITCWAVFYPYIQYTSYYAVCSTYYARTQLQTWEGDHTALKIFFKNFCVCSYSLKTED